MPPLATPSKPPPKRVLVVEDEPLVALTITKVLAIGGHAVEVAPDAEKALTLFQAGKFDLVITDFHLPQMDGMELAEAIRKLVPGQPIILITAFAEKVQGNTDQVSNVDLLLGKPFSVVQLQQAFAKLFPQ